MLSYMRKSLILDHISLLRNLVLTAVTWVTLTLLIIL